MSDPKQAFHLEEYKQLRTEVASLLGRIELLFRYALVVTATVSAWLIVNSVGVKVGTDVWVKPPTALLTMGWLISPAFIFCAGVMADNANTRIKQIGRYLATLENRYGEPELGWEKFLAAQESIITTNTKRVWWALFVLAVLATVVGLCTLYCRGVSCLVGS